MQPRGRGNANERLRWRLHSEKQSTTTCTRPGSAVLPRMQSYTSASGGILTDGYSGHDQRVAVEKSRGLGRQVSAEVLEEKVLLGLLLAAAFGSHGVYEWG